MWRTTVLVAGLALAIGAVGANDVSAQARGKGNGQAKATPRFEQRDARKPASGRSTQRESDRRYQDERDDRRDREVYRRDDDDAYGRGDYDRRYGDSQARGGPAFCRSGAGHPTKGRQWCYDKGYGLGNERWSRAGGYEDIVFGRTGRRSSDGRMSGSVLQDVLGRIVYGRLLSQSNSYGWGALTGRWLDASAGPRILQVQAGGHPLAEFYDQNRDGRVDLVMMNRRR